MTTDTKHDITTCDCADCDTAANVAFHSEAARRNEFFRSTLHALAENNGPDVPAHVRRAARQILHTLTLLYGANRQTKLARINNPAVTLGTSAEHLASAEEMMVRAMTVHTKR